MHFTYDIFTSSNDSSCFAVQIKSEQAIQSEVAFANLIVGLVNVTIQRENESRSMLGNSVRRIRWLKKMISPGSTIAKDHILHGVSEGRVLLLFRDQHY
jgi:hypothetical protein